MTALVVAANRGDLATEVRKLRDAAESRYSEVDLLVATLRDHIRDLQIERDRLRSQLHAAHERRRLDSAAWLHRGLKSPR